MRAITITPLSEADDTLDQLTDILVEVVAGGGSVSFMHPLAPEVARAFWAGALASAARGERVVLGAWDGARLLGTVSLLLDTPPNQPHRGEIAKMMTRPEARGRGVATALLAEAERRARDHDRHLLVLDTASDGGAASLYERCGYDLAGEIPQFALKPHGGLSGTRIYFKLLQGEVADAAS